MLSQNTWLGVYLCGIGFFFTFLGVMLFFNRAFLALGNMSLLSGVTLIMGPAKTRRFLFQRKKLAGTSCFLFGLLLIFWGWTFVGLILEVFGFVNLFFDFFPQVLSVARNLPYVGTILSLPFIKPIIDRIVSTQLPV